MPTITKTEGKQTHKQLHAKVTRNTLFNRIGNCLPPFHQLHN